MMYRDGVDMVTDSNFFWEGLLKRTGMLAWKRYLRRNIRHSERKIAGERRLRRERLCKHNGLFLKEVA